MVGAALCLAVLATVGAETGPLKYDLQEFKDKYVRPGKPNDDPKTKEGHDAYDPFHLPMPTLKTENISPEDAFKEMDKDGDGYIKGGEFKGIRETGHFHLPELPDLKNFGMKKDLWIKRCSHSPWPSGYDHGNQVVTGTAEEAFDFSDADKNGALNKKEYDHAVAHLRSEP